jgi:hypothetical protein
MDKQCVHVVRECVCGRAGLLCILWEPERHPHHTGVPRVRRPLTKGHRPVRLRTEPAPTYGQHSS